MKWFLNFIFFLSFSFALHSMDFKIKSDDELLKIVEDAVFHFAGDSNALDSANSALAEFRVRPFGKKNKEKLIEFSKKLKKSHNICFITEKYLVEKAGFHIETLGIPAQFENEHIHIYPVPLFLQILESWYAHSGDETLEEYMRKYTTNEDKEELLKVKLAFLTPEEIEESLLSFEGSTVKIGREAPEDGKYIFVLDMEGERLAGKNALYLMGETGGIRHSSFFSGKPVQCAGKFTIVNGKIESFKLHSGHYHPQARHGENLRAFLRNKGYENADTIAIRLFEEKA